MIKMAQINKESMILLNDSDVFKEINPIFII